MSSDSSSDADSSMTSSTTTEERNNSIDRNRNITIGLENNANFSAVKQLTTFNNNLNNQIISENGGSFKLLKKPPPVPHSTPIHRPLKTHEDQDEVNFLKKFREIDSLRTSVYLLHFDFSCKSIWRN